MDAKRLEELKKLLGGFSQEEIAKALANKELPLPKNIEFTNSNISSSDSVEVRIESLQKGEQKLLDELSLAYRGVSYFTDRFNQIFEEYNIKADDRAHKALLKSPVDAQLATAGDLRRDGAGELQGVLYKTTVESVLSSFTSLLENLITLLSNQRLQELLAGIMQSGKTGTFSCHFLLLPVIMHVLTAGKVKIVSLLNVPPYLSMRTNTIAELEASLQICGRLVFRKDGFSCSVREYWDKVRSCSAFKTKSFEDLVVIRTKTGLAAREQLNNLIEKEGFTHVFIYTDEGHWGSTKNGIQHQLVRDLKGLPIHEVVISATADEIYSEEVKEDWHVSRLSIGPNFVGPGHLNGVKIPSIDCDGPVALPMVCDMDLFDGIEVEMIENAYFEYDVYKKKIQGLKESAQEWEESYETEWKNYKQKFLNGLVHLISNRLDWDEGHREIFFRFSTNEHCKEIIRDINKHLVAKLNREFAFIEFFDGENSTIKELCQQVLKQEKYAIIFSTAGARLSCPFNRTCSTFVDFTETCTTSDALLQGTFGRACGYNKMVGGEPPLVLVRPKVKEQFEDLKDNNFKLGAMRRPGRRTHTDFPRAPKKKNGTWNHSFIIHNHPKEEVKWASGAFNQAWTAFGRPTQSIPDERAGGHQNKTLNTVLKTIFSNEFLKKLPEYYPEVKHYELLRWGEDDKSPQYGPKAPAADCKLCVGRKCIGHPAFKMDVKSHGGNPRILVGFSTSLTPPANISELCEANSIADLSKESDDVARRPGAGNYTRKFKHDITGLRNSSAWNEKKREEGGAVTPSVSLKFKAIPCPEPGCPIKDVEQRLWSLLLEGSKNHKKVTGHWPKVIRETCCFKNSQVELLSVILRLAKEGKPIRNRALGAADENIPIYIDDDSRYNASNDAEVGEFEDNGSEQEIEESEGSSDEEEEDEEDEEEEEEEPEQGKIYLLIGKTGAKFKVEYPASLQEEFNKKIEGFFPGVKLNLSFEKATIILKVFSSIQDKNPEAIFSCNKEMEVWYKDQQKKKKRKK